MQEPDAGMPPVGEGAKRQARLLAAAALVALCVAMALNGGVAGAQGTAFHKRHVMHGVSVTAVQQRVGVPADGIWGPQTAGAVKRFQRRHGLTVDGIVGPQTARAMGLRIRARRASRPRGVRAKLRAIARCESGGDPTAVSSGGTYRGKYQFDRATWRAMGGHGDPAQASEAEQDRRAAKLLRQQGSSAWPSCG